MTASTAMPLTPSIPAPWPPSCSVFRLVTEVFWLPLPHDLCTCCTLPAATFPPYQNSLLSHFFQNLLRCPTLSESPSCPWSNTGGLSLITPHLILQFFFTVFILFRLILCLLVAFCLPSPPVWIPYMNRQSFFSCQTSSFQNRAI